MKMLLLLGGLLIFQISFSQKNYLTGKVITLQHDTLTGYIDYRNWEVNPKIISFKKEITSEEIIYSPLEISGFQVSDEIYLSALVDSEISPSKINLPREAAPVIRNEATFLQVLFEGSKSLYHSKNTEGNDNFYIKKDSAIELLVYKKYMREEGGRLVTLENKKYTGQLTLYLNNCSTIQSKLKSTAYNKKELLNLFNTYYQCAGMESEYRKKEEKIKTELGVLAGPSLNTINFSGDGNVQILNADYTTHTNFTAGIYFDVILSRNLNKWSIINELTFASYNITGKYAEQETPSRYVESKITMGYSYLKLGNMVRYRFFSGKNISTYANFGIINGYALKENSNNRLTKTIFHDVETVTEATAIEDTRKYEQGYIVGIGAKQNRLTGEIRYERGNGMSAYRSLSSTRTSYYLIIAYRL